MRYLALAIACSGCVISAPDGAPQFWPPGLGGTVEAVVAGDLDADGATDIVVIQSGTDSQAGLYLIDADQDLEWKTSKIVRSFSQFVPMDLQHPVGAYLDVETAPRLYVAAGTDTLAITQFTNNLVELASADTTVPNTGIAWARPVTFPGGMVHFVVSNGATIEHLDATLAEPHPIPAPMGMPNWTGAQVATSYAPDATTTDVVVATADAIYRAPLPTAMGAPFVYETVRTGAPWSGQIAFDLDGDGREEIIGFDVEAHQLCVVDPGSATIPVTPSCVQLTSTFSGTDVTIIAGANLSMEAGLDILVAQATGSETSYSLAQDVMYTGGNLTATMVVTIPVAGPARGRTVIARPSATMPYSVLTFGTEGQVFCGLGPC